MVCFIAGLQLKHFKQRTLKPPSGSACIYNKTSIGSVYK
jgi:hypothetical protein